MGARQEIFSTRRSWDTLGKTTECAQRADRRARTVERRRPKRRRAAVQPPFHHLTTEVRCRACPRSSSAGGGCGPQSLAPRDGTAGLANMIARLRPHPVQHRLNSLELYSLRFTPPFLTHPKTRTGGGSTGKCHLACIRGLASLTRLSDYDPSSDPPRGTPSSGVNTENLSS